MQIIVLGPHRSGTSLVTRLINMMGAYCFGEGTSIGFNEENPKGFWERRDVIEANDKLLAAAGASWDRPAAWHPGDIDENAKFEYQQRFRQILLNLDANRPWVIKDPRLCLTLPVLKPLLEVPVVVLVSRSPLESAASLLTRNHLSLHYGLALWEFYAVAALKAAIGIPMVSVSYGDFLTQPLEAVEVLYRQLEESGVSGLSMPSAKEIEAFIDPTLWREKTSPVLEDACLTQQHRLLLDMFQGKRKVESSLEPSPITLSILGEPTAAASPQPQEQAQAEEVEHDDIQLREAEEAFSLRLEEIEAERDTLQLRLEQVESELRVVRRSLEHSQEKARNRRAVLGTLMAILGEDEMNDVPESDQLRQVAARMGTLQQQQQLMLQDLVQLENYIFELERILRAIQGSAAWRQASRAAAWIGRMTGRSPSRIMEDAAHVFAAFDHWRKARN